MQQEGRSCLNCGAVLAGEYCSACGQAVRDPDPSLRELIAEIWGEFISVDGKLLSSLRLLLLRPGALTVEFLSGRRARHLTPFRLYLLCSVAYFLLASLLPDHGRRQASVTFAKADTLADNSEEAPKGVSTDSLRVLKARSVSLRDSVTRTLLMRHGIIPAAGALDSATRVIGDSLLANDEAERMTGLPPWMKHRLANGIRHVKRDKKNFGSDYLAQLPRLLFVLMPVFALMLAIAYYPRRRRYPVHLVVALHLHAFVFAMLAIGQLSPVIAWRLASLALKMVLVLWILAYLPLALRRVYGGRLAWAVLRTLGLAFVYSLVGLGAFSALAFVLLLTY